MENNENENQKCRCIAQVNQNLQQEISGAYLRVTTNLRTGEMKPVIAAERRTGKGKVPPIVPSFCPFCGRKY